MIDENNEIEPLEDDLKELGDKEAFEDQIAETSEDNSVKDDSNDDLVDEPEIVNDEEVNN